MYPSLASMSLLYEHNINIEIYQMDNLPAVQAQINSDNTLLCSACWHKCTQKVCYFVIVDGLKIYGSTYQNIAISTVWIHPRVLLQNLCKTTDV